MPKLSVEKREVFGKKVDEYRKAGKMPIVVYGGKEESQSYFINLAEFKKILAHGGESDVLELDTDSGKKNTLIHDIDFDPITREPRHADLLVVDINKPVQVSVELEFVGEAPAIKAGGTLVKVMHEIEIEALPTHIPHQIEVNTETLVDFDSQITVADLKLPAGVTAVADPEEVVASISQAVEEVAEEAPVDLSSIEVEKKGKQEEEGAETAE